MLVGSPSHHILSPQGLMKDLEDRLGRSRRKSLECFGITVKECFEFAQVRVVLNEGVGLLWREPNRFRLFPTFPVMAGQLVLEVLPTPDHNKYNMKTGYNRYNMYLPCHHCGLYLFTNRQEKLTLL